MLKDISPPLNADIAVFPGDVPLRRNVMLDRSRGHLITLSSLQTTVHVGAHIDGPNHYSRVQAGVDAWPLERCIGPCQVISVDVQRGALVQPVQLASHTIEHERVLVHTGTYPDPTHYNTDFAALHPDTVDLLHEGGVQLVGIDTPSMDPSHSKTLEAHQRFAAHDMIMLEGLVLQGVPDGVYELIALPLRLEGFDASPVRAVLRTIDQV
jgi:arylformamidase